TIPLTIGAATGTITTFVPPAMTTVALTIAGTVNWQSANPYSVGSVTLNGGTVTSASLSFTSSGACTCGGTAGISVAAYVLLAPIRFRACPSPVVPMAVCALFSAAISCGSYAGGTATCTLSQTGNTMTLGAVTGSTGRLIIS